VIAFSAPDYVLVQGVINGLSYGLLALGLVLIYRTTRVLNFAQGQLGAVAAVFMVKLTHDFGIAYGPSLIAACVLAGGAGAVCELVLRRLSNRPRVLVMVATIGLAQVLFLFTAMPFIRPKKLSLPFPVPFHLSLTMGGYHFTPGQVLTLIVAPLVAIALALFIRLSPWGLAMRASAENAPSARLAGVWVRRASTLTWVIAALLSAAAAILNAPGQTSSLTNVLSPDLLLVALTAAIVGAMSNLTVAFVAAIALGVIEEVVHFNVESTATIQLIMFGILLMALLVRVRTLQRRSRTEERATWDLATVTVAPRSPRRLRVRAVGLVVALVTAAVLPLLIDAAHLYLLPRICIFAVVALSLTILTGWAGQLSLGQFGLVAIGAVMAARLGTSVPLVVLLPFAGAITALVAVLVGLPALRVRGLYLAVSSLGFALVVQQALLATPCWTVPLVHRRLCTGLPNPRSTLITPPSLFGMSLRGPRAFAWFSIGILVLSLLMVTVWRDRGLARRLVAVRDNETASGVGGIPTVGTKILAFALSGFMAGYAGVCLAFADQRISVDTFAPAVSILVVSMVVIGGLGSITGSVAGAIYLVGVPAILGATSTTQFLTSGIGLLAFILYLPGGLGELVTRIGDLVEQGWQRAVHGPPPDARGEPAATGDDLREVMAEAVAATPAPSAGIAPVVPSPRPAT
jgi:ABC-type branched-subunit amino acid transport system permease subunit